MRPAAIAFLCFLLAGPAQEFTRLTGRITDGDGRPAAEVKVGLVRAGQIDGDAEEVQPEIETRTARDGTFSFRIPRTHEGLDRVHVFTFSFGHRNQVYDGANFRGILPAPADFRAKGVRPIDLTAGDAEVSITLWRKRGGRKTVMVTMRDEAGLATDVYLPDDEGKYPALLMRTPYGRR
ncbi:MAG: hypothetical protein ACYTAF_06455, partial [Planctomycetota bacterium]